MSVFSTTDEQCIHLATIIVAMKDAGLEHHFIASVDKLARIEHGVYALMAMWLDAENSEERDEILADLQDSLDDFAAAPPEPLRKPYIAYKDLGAVAAEIVAFKQRLRALIDRNGGVSKVAKLTGIPQPSLSRLLNSASMPRRTTIYKIAEALNVPETEINSSWVR